MEDEMSGPFGRIASVTLVALSFSGAALAREQLVIGISQFPSNFHPNIESMVAKSYVLGMTLRPFTIFDRDWRVICMLCEELPSIENGLARVVDQPDGTKGVALTYTIRKNARWGDGTPVTTKDAIFTWEVGRHPLSGVGNSEMYRRITSIEAHDDRRFTMHVNKFTCEYAAINDFQLLPAHLDRDAFADPAQYKTRSRFETDTTNPGLWTGPYRITQVVSGSHIVLEANPTWWGEKPEFKRIVVRAIENTAALEANLLSGSIDYIAGELGLSLDQGLAFEKRHGGRFDVRFKPGLIYEHIDLNLGHPALADRRVRRAIMHAIDREALNRQLFEGKQPVALTFVNPLDTVFSEDVPRYAYDPKRAAELLEEAGWRPGPDGIRRNAQGERLSFEFMTTAGNRLRELVQQTLQSQWRQSGIEARIRNEPARVFFGETVRNRKFSAFAMFAWLSSPRNVPRTTLHSSQIPTAENGFSGQNYTGFKNEAVDALIDRIEIACEEKENRALWQRLQQLYAEELPVLPLYYRADPFVIPKWLSGIEPTGHQYPTSLWVEHWRAKN
jgi:peptide/nickel transport system substrate-binding protein